MGKNYDLVHSYSFYGTSIFVQVKPTFSNNLFDLKLANEIQLQLEFPCGLELWWMFSDQNQVNVSYISHFQDIFLSNLFGIANDSYKCCLEIRYRKNSPEKQPHLQIEIRFVLEPSITGGITYQRNSLCNLHTFEMMVYIME